MEQNKQPSASPRFRLNVIDLLIVLIVLACAVGLVVRFGNVGKMGAEESLRTYDIYFTVSNIAYTAEAAFVSGDTVTLADSGVVLGEFVALESILPAEFLSRDANGNLISVRYPESTRIDVTGRITAHGVMSENGFLVNGTTYVASGAEYSVQSEHMDFILKITSIVEK